MNINTKTSLVGFLLALATLNSPSTAKTIDEAGKGISSNAPSTQPSLEQRLNRLNAAIRAREDQLSESSQSQNSQNTFRVARGWADGRDRDWVNGRRTGWADGHGRDWVNVNPWRNGWTDAGGFYNSNPWSNAWRKGGGWVDGRDGGFVNVR